MDDSTQMMGAQSPTSVPGPTTMPDYSVGGANNNKKIGAIVGIIVIVLVAGGVGVWAWFTYGMNKTPDQVFAKMFENSKAIKSFSYDSKTTFEAANPTLSPTPISVVVTMKGANQEGTLATAKAQSIMDITAKTPYGDLSAAVEERMIDNTAYFQITKLPIEVGAMLGLFGVSADKGIVNQWGSLNFDELKKAIEEAKNDPSVTDADKQSADDLIGLLSGTYATPQMEQQIMDLYKKYNLVKVKNVLAKESLDGQKMYHYDLELNKATLFPFLKDLITLVAPNAMKDTKPEELAQGEKDFNDAIQAVPLSFEVWIGTKDYYLHKLIVNVSLDGKTDAGKKLLSDLGNDAEGVTMKATTEVSMKDFNKPVEVVKPEGAQSLIELFKSQTKPVAPVSNPDSLNGATTDTEKDTDGDGLPDFMETEFYKTDPNNPDTDGDGFKDGDEVKNGYNPAGPGKLYE